VLTIEVSGFLDVQKSEPRQSAAADEEKEEGSLLLPRLFGQRELASREQERDNGDNKQEDSHAEPYAYR
jgi:hypothetical protein